MPIAPTIAGTVPPKKAVPVPNVDTDNERAAQVWDVAGVKELFNARATGMGGAERPGRHDGGNVR